MVAAGISQVLLMGAARLARSGDGAQRGRGAVSPGAAGIALPSRDTCVAMHLIGRCFVNAMFGGLHLLQRAPAGDRQVGDHVLELAAEGWVVRELPMNGLGE